MCWKEFDFYNISKLKKRVKALLMKLFKPKAYKWRFTVVQLKIKQEKEMEMLQLGIASRHVEVGLLIYRCIFVCFLQRKREGMKPWLQGRLALSKQTSRFELPMDVRLLEGTCYWTYIYVILY